MALRLTLALLMLAVTIVVAGRRVGWLTRLIRSGQPAPGTHRQNRRPIARPARRGVRAATLLRWTVPGVAHFFTFWGFIVLAITIVEAYGALVISEDFAFPFFGHARWLGFLEDFFAVAVLVALIIFAVVRLRNAPERQHRASRFYGSHTGPAWVILGMITLVDRHPAALSRSAVQHRPLPVRHARRRLRVLRRRAAARRRRLQPGHRDVLPARADGGDLRLRDHRRVLQAPAHRDRAAERHDQAVARRHSARCCPCRRRSRRPDRLLGCGKPDRGHRRSAGARSRTSPGRATSTSRPAPSAGAASPSARRGTPASRCRPSS